MKLSCSAQICFQDSELFSRFCPKPNASAVTATLVQNILGIPTSREIFTRRGGGSSEFQGGCFVLIIMTKVKIIAQGKIGHKFLNFLHKGRGWSVAHLLAQISPEGCQHSPGSLVCYFSTMRGQ